MHMYRNKLVRMHTNTCCQMYMRTYATALIAQNWIHDTERTSSCHIEIHFGIWINKNIASYLHMISTIYTYVDNVITKFHVWTTDNIVNSSN